MANETKYVTALQDNNENIYQIKDKEARDNINILNEQINNIPTQANATILGTVKLTESISSRSNSHGINSGYATTPKAVYDYIQNTIANINTSTVSDINMYSYSPVQIGSLGTIPVYRIGFNEIIYCPADKTDKFYSTGTAIDGSLDPFSSYAYLNQSNQYDYDWDNYESAALARKSSIPETPIIINGQSVLCDSDNRPINRPILDTVPLFQCVTDMLSTTPGKATNPFNSEKNEEHIFKWFGYVDYIDGALL